MKYYGTEGILLALRDRGEADRILTFYTKNIGRIDAVAAGIRNSHSKLRGHLGIYNHVRIIVMPGRHYWRLIDVEEIAGREAGADEKARDSFVKMFLKLVSADEPHGLLWEELSRLNEITHPAAFAALKIKTLSHLGMFPAPQELPRFFTKTAVAWLSGSADGVFLRNPAEATLFEDGIRKILAANHVL